MGNVDEIEKTLIRIEGAIDRLSAENRDLRDRVGELEDMQKTHEKEHSELVYDIRTAVAWINEQKAKPEKRINMTNAIGGIIMVVLAILTFYNQAVPQRQIVQLSADQIEQLAEKVRGN